MCKRKTIKEKLLEGATVDALVEEGYYRCSVIKALHELENGIGVGKRGRKGKSEERWDASGLINTDSLSTDEQYVALAAAIIKAAVTDLTKCYAYEVKHKIGGLGVRGMTTFARDIEDWIMTESSHLTNVPPEVLIQAARERAHRGKTKAIRAESPQKPRDPYTTKKDYRRKEYRNG